MRGWLTIDEACTEFHVSRRTIQRWREKHPIRAARFHKRLPLMLNRDDLMKADRASMRANPAIPA